MPQLGCLCQCIRSTTHPTPATPLRQVTNAYAPLVDGVTDSALDAPPTAVATTETVQQPPSECVPGVGGDDCTKQTCSCPTDFPSCFTANDFPA